MEPQSHPRHPFIFQREPRRPPIHFSAAFYLKFTDCRVTFLYLGIMKWLFIGVIEGDLFTFEGGRGNGIIFFPIAEIRLKERTS